MADPGHIVIIRLSSVGDVILASPVAAELRHRYPRARISWVIDAHYLALIEKSPHIDAAVAFDYTGEHRGPAGIRRLARKLAPADLVVDLQHKVRSVLLTAYLRPARRNVLVKRRGFGLIRAMVGRDAILRGPHQVERYLDVLDDGGEVRSSRPSLYLTNGDRQKAAPLLPDVDRPTLGLVTGAKHFTKRWPLRHAAALAGLGQEAGVRVVLLGGGDDEALSQIEVDRTAVLAGRSLGELAALIERCDVLVSPDSGPAHMAAALGVPVVALFGPTSPDRWEPRGDQVRVERAELPCSPCSNYGGATCPVGTLECMEGLTPERVWRTCQGLLGQTRGA